MNVDYGASSHVGMKRENNEDSYLVMPDQGLFAVCDGMGGYLAGEVASRLACDETKQFFEMTDRDNDVTWPFKLDKALSYDENRLAVAVKLANQTVFERGQTDPKCRGLGTTFVGMLFTGDGQVVVAHAGDSRCYVYRDGEMQRLTGDHSLVEEYVRMGRITAEEAKTFPQKNIILRALGQQRTVDVEVHSHQPQQGDIFLLCTDGLCGMIEDEEMRDILRQETGVGHLTASTDSLVSAANAAGGLDNVTVVLARWPPQ